MPLTLNGTTGVAGVDGSSSTPALQGTDTNTGVVFGTDTMSLVTGGSTALSADSSQNVSVTNTLAMGSSFKRNRIINGNMQVWQRGTSFSGGGAYYTADRWQNAGQTGTYSQSSDAPTGFQYSLSIASLAANYATLAQRIEAANCNDLSGQTITISFYAKATTGGASGLTINPLYATASDNFSSTTSIGSTTTAALTSTWTRYTATFTSLPSGVTNGIQLNIFNAAGGSAAITYLITGVQIEVGSVATPYERQIYSDQLAQCQRYFQIIDQMSLLHARTTTSLESSIMYPVWFRATPTVQANPVAYNVFDAFGTSFTQSAGSVGFAVSGSTSKGAFINLLNFTGLTQGRTYVTNAASSGSFGLSAEL